VYDGVPIGETVVRVVDGEVQIGGPTLAEGYLGDPALTAERFVDDDGMRWFRTADAGTWHGGRLTIAGRLDDVIISGGVKVSLGAVERLLHENGVPGAVVVKAHHEKWGEVPVAFVADDADIAPAMAAIETTLGPAARPRLRRGSGIPYLPSGKPDRVTLQKMATE
jgi:O-succinylbenzoic acid--CoA ligase